MTLIAIVVLALIQGITEFLPISSSGHLILVPVLFGWSEQGLAFDVAVHVGTLIAVVGYFRRDVYRLATAGTAALWQRQWQHPDARLVLQLMIATVPIVIVGLCWTDALAEQLRAPRVVAAATAGFALLLWAADYLSARNKSLLQLTLLGALVIGLFQVLAVIPGTSRSGITLTAALLLGLSRVEAARFSFLLSIPVIALAGGWQFVEWLQSAEAMAWSTLLLGVALSAISAWVCIGLLLNWIERVGVWPFVVYRLLLAILILMLLGSRL